MEENTKGIQQLSMQEEKSEFLKQTVMPFCNYIKKEVEGSKKGILVIAVDGDIEDDGDHVMLCCAGNDDHLVQAIGRIYSTPNGEILQRAMDFFCRRILHLNINTKR